VPRVEASLGRKDTPPVTVRELVEQPTEFPALGSKGIEEEKIKEGKATPKARTIEGRRSPGSRVLGHYIPARL
jgi:hypothetical protein